MNSTYYNTWGIHLPFRFYNNRALINAASDYGRQIVIPKSEYLIMPFGVLLPFQITRLMPASPYVFNYTFNVYCVGDVAETDPLSLTLDSGKILIEPESSVPTNGVQRIIFYGDEALAVPIAAGGYFAKIEESFDGTTRTWYSENFNVLDIDQDIDFRQYTNSNIDLRTVNGTDLRIV
jgi:hypothetical protein